MFYSLNLINSSTLVKPSVFQPHLKQYLKDFVTQFTPSQHYSNFLLQSQLFFFILHLAQNANTHRFTGSLTGDT